MKKNVLKSKTVLHRTSIRFDQIKLIVIHSKTFSHTREIFINCRLIELFFLSLPSSKNLIALFLSQHIVAFHIILCNLTMSTFRCGIHFSKMGLVWF